MNQQVWGLLIAGAALVVSLVSLSLTVQQRGRQERAAVTADLYPVLRQLRDSAWQWAKPLGGMNPDHVIAVHYGLVDLLDPTPAIADRSLRQQCQTLLEHDAAGVAMSIDPPRFQTLIGGDELVSSFTAFARLADAALQRCQALRKGATK